MSEHTTHHLTCDCRRTRCRSCRAPIVWAVSYGGAKIPMNAEPDDVGGNIALHLDEQGLVHADVLSMVDAKTARAARERDLYTSHFVTCPNADKHRKDRR